MTQVPSITLWVGLSVGFVLGVTCQAGRLLGRWWVLKLSIFFLKRVYKPLKVFFRRCGMANLYFRLTCLKLENKGLRVLAQRRQGRLDVANRSPARNQPVDLLNKVDDKHE